MAARVQSVLEIAHVGILFRVDPRVREENRQVADEELHLCCLSSEIHAAATTSPPPPPRAKLIRISLVLDPQTLLGHWIRRDNNAGLEVFPEIVLAFGEDEVIVSVASCLMPKYRGIYCKRTLAQLREGAPATQFHTH